MKASSTIRNLALGCASCVAAFFSSATLICCENPLEAETAYAVAYDGNGSEGGSAPADNARYLPGDMVSVPGNPGGLFKTGQSFTGWNTESGGGGVTYTQGQSLNMGRSDLRLYAKWTDRPTYSVVYHGNGNSGGLPPEDTTRYEPGQQAVVFGNDAGLEKSGSYFTGWNTESDGGGAGYRPGAVIEIGAAPVVLYAQWSSGYAIRYEANAAAATGSAPADAGTYAAGDEAVVAGNAGSLSRPGYELAGWNTRADGAGASYAPGAVFAMPPHDTVLYAVWIPENLTFEAAGTSITISGYVAKPTGSLQIPGGVTAIGYEAFKGCAGLTDVYIPFGVSEIGAGAFQQCTSLVDVQLPYGLRTIAQYAFSNTALASVKFPPTLETIGPSAFSDSNLSHVSIPASVTSIGSRAFAFAERTAFAVSADNPRYSSLDGALFDKAGTTLLAAYCPTGTYTVPASVSAIGPDAFRDCAASAIVLHEGIASIGSFAFASSYAASIVLPAGIPNIGFAAFAYAEHLTSMTLPSSVDSIGASAFSGCLLLASVAMPANVASIGANAFFNCRKLNNVTVPAAVTSIGDSAFASCYELTNLTMLRETPPTLGSNAFQNASAGLLIHVPSAAAVTAYSAATRWSAYASRIVTP